MGKNGDNLAKPRMSGGKCVDSISKRKLPLGECLSKRGKTPSFMKKSHKTQTVERGGQTYECVWVKRSNYARGGRTVERSGYVRKGDTTGYRRKGYYKCPSGGSGQCDPKEKRFVKPVFVEGFSVSDTNISPTAYTVDPKVIVKRGHWQCSKRG